MFQFFKVGLLLQIYLVAPISSATSERSFSTLKRTKTWMRSTQGELRLSALASMQIEKEVRIVQHYNRTDLGPIYFEDGAQNDVQMTSPHSDWLYFRLSVA